MTDRLLRTAVAAALALLTANASAQSSADQSPRAGFARLPSPPPDESPASTAPSQDPFVIPGSRPKPFTLGGYLELRPVAVRLDPESVFSRLREPEPGEGWLSLVNGQLLVDAGYRRGLFGASTRTVLDGSAGNGAWRGDVTSYEAWISLKPTTSISIDAGKRTMKWGKGYAWNPAAFLDRPKDPEDPTLALEGVVVWSADLIRSLRGPLQTIAVTPVLVPVYDGVNESVGRTGYLHGAGKLYLLLFDTDLDFMFMSGGSRAARWGLDFARNLRSDIEVHGELAVSGDEALGLVGPDGQVTQERRGGAAWLVGSRYLAPTNTTVIVEYYRRDFGFTEQEMQWYYDAVNDALRANVGTRDPLALSDIADLGRAGYAGRHPMRNYVYARMSQPDAFGQLYLNAALTTIYNVDDGSFSLMQEFQYRLLGNLELRSQIGGSIGPRGTDFGERQGDLRFELRARYSF